MVKKEQTAVVYARVSTARQADDGLPVESQIEQCCLKAEAMGGTVVKIFRDDGVSGRTSKRPGFQSALDYCDDHQIDFFVCWSSSRFARNHIDAALNKRVLTKSGTKLVFVSQDFGESDEAWMIESIVAIMDEQYSRSIAKDTRRSMAKNAADGFWNGGHEPFGYFSAPIGKRRRLSVVESEAIVVRTIFRWCIEGLGQKEIALRLNSSGIRRRGKVWDKSSVASVLRSRALIGQIVFVDRGNEIVTPAHEAILSDDVFLLAQEKIKSRSPRNDGGRPRSGALFSGLLICDKCGEQMYTESATGRAGKRYHYYNCRSFLKGIGCVSRRVSVESLDSYLIGAVCERIFTAENIAGIALELKTEAGTWARENQQKIDSFASELSGVDKRLRKLYESVEAGAGLNLSDIAPRLRELRAQQDSLRIEIERLCSDPGPQMTLVDGEASASARVFKEILVTAENPSRIREFLSQVISSIRLGDADVCINYLPERIVNASFGDSQCDVRWLPDMGTVRTRKVSILLPKVGKLAA